MTAPADSRRTLWGLLGLWVSLELLVASRWWLATPTPPPAPAPRDGSALRDLLAGQKAPRVWFAPYTTFPETGMVESRNQSGVYDTFLAIPPDRGVTTNYGAARLTPADTLFSLASSLGLPSEWQLAQKLGYSLFALDTGALRDPAAGIALCRRTAGCRLSGEGTALFRLDSAGGAADAGAAGLKPLERRIAQLPYQSGGPSWGPLVFRASQWEPPSWDRAGSLWRVNARAQEELQIYRYPLERFPAATRPWLRLGNEDVQLVLNENVSGAQICLLPPGGRRCETLILLPDQPRVAIGDRLRPGGLTRLQLKQVFVRQGATPVSSPLRVEIHAPAAAAALQAP